MKRGSIIDLAVVVVDWLNILDMLATQNMDVAKITRMGKLGRLLRFATVFRLTKLVDACRNAADQLLVHGYTIVFNLCKLFALLLAIAYIGHLMACAWFSTSRKGYSDTGVRWIDLTLNGSGVKLPCTI